MRWLLTGILAIGAAGCMNTNGVYEAQRRNVAAITDPQQRSDALAKTAESAASIGDSATVKLALADLNDDRRRDEVAEICAIQLGNGGHWLAANDTAKLIKDEAKRKEALAKVGW